MINFYKLQGKQWVCFLIQGSHTVFSSEKCNNTEKVKRVISNPIDKLHLFVE